MTLSTQDALIYLMVVAATSDAKVSDRELDIIGNLVSRSPVVEGFDRDHLGQSAQRRLSGRDPPARPSGPPAWFRTP